MARDSGYIYISKVAAHGINGTIDGMIWLLLSYFNCKSLCVPKVSTWSRNNIHVFTPQLRPQNACGAYMQALEAGS